MFHKGRLHPSNSPTQDKQGLSNNINTQKPNFCPKRGTAQVCYCKQCIKLFCVHCQELSYKLHPYHHCDNCPFTTCKLCKPPIKKHTIAVCQRRMHKRARANYLKRAERQRITNQPTPIRRPNPPFIQGIKKPHELVILEKRPNPPYSQEIKKSHELVITD